MSKGPLVIQPSSFSDRSELRAMFRQYLQADIEPVRLDWESVTTANGLPHNWIYDLFQDSRGRVWVGTWGGGLARYEAGKWRIFTKEHGLHCNEVTCIREDEQGRLWLATDGGLNVMEDDRISDAGLSGKSLLNITFDRHGNLWAGCWRAATSGGGLFRFDGHNWEAFTTRGQLPGLEILKVFNDTRDWLWVGTYEQGIGAGVGYFDGHEWHNFTSRDGLVNDCVYSMFEDPGGNMWFGTIGGVGIFDGKNWHQMTAKDGLVDNRVYSMLIDSHKKMWFGTEGGVSHFDGSTWVSYTKKDGLVENLVRCIIETGDNTLWFGTYPYAAGRGGISIARYQGGKSLTDHLLDLLPGPLQQGTLPPGDDE
jgi:ligand-binding sensor domain-containing protein